MLIRAGKLDPLKSSSADFNIPVPNDKRSFLQISTSPLEKIKGEPKTVTEYIKESRQVKNLVEWETAKNQALAKDADSWTGHERHWLVR